MPTLEKRVEALEQSVPRADTVTTIFLVPGTNQPTQREIRRVTGGNGQEWTRQPGETEEELFDRASREVTRSGLGCIALMAGD